jgi:hypothetical protein
MSGSKTMREAPGPVDEDAASRGLTREDRSGLSMDAWEPSLLRHMLHALGRDRPADPGPEREQRLSKILE